MGVFRSSKGRTALVSAWAVVVLGAVALLTVVSGTNAAPTPVQALELAAHTTLGAKTASVSLVETVDAAGISETVSGSGVADLATGDMLLSVGVNIPGGLGKINETLLSVGGSKYEKVGLVGSPPAEQSIFQSVLGTKPWIEIPTTGTPSVGASDASLNPGSMLRILEQKGAKVTALAPKSFADGVARGFRADLPASAMAKQIRSAEATLGLPAADRAAITSMAGMFSSMVVELWIGPSNTIEEMDLQVAGNVLGESTNAHAVIRFSDFGRPVHLVAPPASQTTTFEQFINGLGQAASGSGS